MNSRMPIKEKEKAKPKEGNAKGEEDKINRTIESFGERHLMHPLIRAQAEAWLSPMLPDQERYRHLLRDHVLDRAEEAVDAVEASDSSPETMLVNASRAQQKIRSIYLRVFFCGLIIFALYLGYWLPRYLFS